MYKMLLFFLFIFIPIFKSMASNSSSLLNQVNKISENSSGLPITEDINRRVASVRNQIQLYDKQLTACQTSKSDTDFYCFEGNDKGINNFLSMMGSISDVGSMAMSASCSKLANLLKIGQGAQVAFRGTCAVKKSNCVDKCAQAEKTFQLIKGDLIKIKNTAEQSQGQFKSSQDDDTKAIARIKPEECEQKPDKNGKILFNNRSQEVTPEECKELIAQAKKEDENWTGTNIGLSAILRSIDESTEAADALAAEGDSPSALKRTCIATQQEAASKATMNIGTLMMSMQQNQACAKSLANFDTGLDLTDCNLTGTCTPTSVDDCADPKYKDSLYCKTPTTAGGATKGAGGVASTGPVGQPNFDLDTKSLPDLDMTGVGDGLSGDSNSPFGQIGDSGGPKSAGVPGGGGGGGLSIPGGSGYNNPNKGGGGRGVSGDFNTGGNPSYAGGLGGFGGGSGDKNKDDLQKYLPGGEKDPSLAKKIGIEGITKPGGLTLFEKVTKGYKHTRSSLIPE